MELEITPEEFKSLRERGESFTLLDVREPKELSLAGLAGSLNMPMGEVAARAHQELDSDAHIVVMCHHGVRSLNVANWLRQQGFEQAQSLRGGIDAWARKMDKAIALY